MIRCFLCKAITGHAENCPGLVPKIEPPRAWPDPPPVMLGHVESPAREVTLDFLGFEKRIFVSADSRRLRIPVFLGPHFPGVEYIEFEQDEDDENLFRLSHVHRTGDCPACAKPDTGTD